MRYDRLVIGNGPDAVRPAIEAAERGQMVALVYSSDDRSDRVTPGMLRQAAARLITGPARNEPVSMSDLRREVAREVESELAAEQAELARAGVDVFAGDVRFIDAQTIEVGTELLSGGNIVIACGTKSARLGQTPFDGRVVLAAEQLPALEVLPHSMIVVGAGQTGLDYAIVLAMLGVGVTVVDDHSSFFDLCGGLMNAPLFEAQSLGIAFRLGDEVIGIEKRTSSPQAAVRLAGGRVLTAEAALVCVGREGRTEGLGLESAGVGLDEHGRVWCDADGRTWAAHITAVGDVVGFRASNTLAG
jgi:NAD(P) transhydrogenase